MALDIVPALANGAVHGGSQQLARSIAPRSDATPVPAAWCAPSKAPAREGGCTMTTKAGASCKARPVEGVGLCIGHQRSVAAAVGSLLGG